MIRHYPKTGAIHASDLVGLILACHTTKPLGRALVWNPDEAILLKQFNFHLKVCPKFC